MGLAGGVLRACLAPTCGTSVLIATLGPLCPPRGCFSLLCGHLPTTCSHQASVLGLFCACPVPELTLASTTPSLTKTHSVNSKAGLRLALDPQTQCHLQGSQPSSVSLLPSAGPILSCPAAWPGSFGKTPWLLFSFLLHLIRHRSVALTFTLFSERDCVSSPPWMAASAPSSPIL